MGTERLAITDPVLLTGLLIGCVLIIFFGRVEIAAGIYCATQRWAYSVDVGPTVWLWVWVFAMVASAIVFYQRQQPSTRLRMSIDAKVPAVVVWGAIFLFWIMVSYVFSPTEYATVLVKNFILYSLLSFLAVSLFGSDFSRVKVFVFTFVGATLISGLVSLPPLPELTYQLQTVNFRLRGMDQINYLAFAVPFAISSIFLLVFVDQARRLGYRILAIVAIVFCVFCLLLTGARQSILAILPAWALFIFWAWRQNRYSRRAMMMTLILGVFLATFLYNQTALVSRWTGPDASLEDLGGRIEVWQAAWDVFLRSPIWGSGFDYFNAAYGAHDLWLDVLAGQGIMGLILLVGFLMAVLRSARGTWTGVGNPDLASWRMGFACVLFYALFQSIVGGQISSMHYLFWISALIWRLGVTARQGDSAAVAVASQRVPAGRQATVSTSERNV